MDSSDIGSLVVIAILISCSAFFSATETAFSSLNRVRIKNMAAEGNKRAALVLKLSERYDRTLSSILIGNNVVNIGTTAIATLLFVKWLGASGATVSTAVTTVVVLVFGEITPKTIAKEVPEAFALAVAPLLNALNMLLTPINFLFSQWKKLIARLLNISGSAGITEEEILTLVNEAEQSGSIGEEDADMIENVFAFNDCRVDDVLTPRVDIVAAEENVSMDDMAALFLRSEYTRIPIYRESIDHIIGTVHLHDFFQLTYTSGASLASIITPVIFVPPSAIIGELLNTLQSEKRHMAVVTDEYGGTMGIVTLEDILEELVGEIWDEHDVIKENLRQLDPNRYLVAGEAGVDDIASSLGFHACARSNTVSGWITERLGKMPADGDSFVEGNIKITVLQTRSRRVVESVFEFTEEPSESAEPGHASSSLFPQ